MKKNMAHLSNTETASASGKHVDKPGEISDGYHTFNELYEFRLLYNAGFFNELYQTHNYGVHKSKLHSDRKLPFGGGWFVVSAELPTGQVTNHYELKDWDLFKIEERTTAVEWDGHTAQDVAKRLRSYLEVTDMQSSDSQTEDKVNSKATSNQQGAVEKK